MIRARASTGLTLSIPNAAIAVGQQVSGYGAPPHFSLRANGVTTSNVLTILGTVPLSGAGATNSATKSAITGITTGMQLMSPGSSAITPGTTVSAVTATSITLSANPTVEMAGVDIVVGGMFVSAVSGTAVTLSVNATGTHTSQNHVFAGSRTKILVTPSLGWVVGNTTLSGVRMQHTGAPDYYIEPALGHR
jgi:hypothetical protein